MNEQLLKGLIGELKNKKINEVNRLFNKGITEDIQFNDEVEADLTDLYEFVSNKTWVTPNEAKAFKNKIKHLHDLFAIPLTEKIKNDMVENNNKEEKIMKLMDVINDNELTNEQFMYDMTPEQTKRFLKENYYSRKEVLSNFDIPPTNLTHMNNKLKVVKVRDGKILTQKEIEQYHSKEMEIYYDKEVTDRVLNKIVMERERKQSDDYLDVEEFSKLIGFSKSYTKTLMTHMKVGNSISKKEANKFKQERIKKEEEYNIFKYMNVKEAGLFCGVAPTTINRDVNVTKKIKNAVKWQDKTTLIPITSVKEYLLQRKKRGLSEEKIDHLLKKRKDFYVSLIKVLSERNTSYVNHIEDLKGYNHFTETVDTVQRRLASSDESGEDEVLKVFPELKDKGVEEVDLTNNPYFFDVLSFGVEMERVQSNDDIIHLKWLGNHTNAFQITITTVKETKRYVLHLGDGIVKNGENLEYNNLPTSIKQQLTFEISEQPHLIGKLEKEREAKLKNASSEEEENQIIYEVDTRIEEIKEKSFMEAYYDFHRNGVYILSDSLYMYLTK